MTKVVTVQHDYPFAPREVWDVATNFECFAEAMKGVATFDGMPAHGRVTQGQTLNVKVRLFRKLPPMDYHMEVVSCDDEAMTFQSLEHGGAIKRWAHRLSVVPTAEGARLIDQIEIDAGLSTAMMGLWARFVYRRRHAPRLRMLAARSRR